MQYASQRQAGQVYNDPAPARPDLDLAITPFYREDSITRSQRNTPAALYSFDEWQNTVNVANHSRDRADLLLSGPQRGPPLSENGPQSSASSEPKRDNKAKRLVKGVSKVFTNRQQEPRSGDGPVGPPDCPCDLDFRLTDVVHRHLLTEQWTNRTFTIVASYQPNCRCPFQWCPLE